MRLCKVYLIGYRNNMKHSLNRVRKAVTELQLERRRGLKQTAVHPLIRQMQKDGLWHKQETAPRMETEIMTCLNAEYGEPSQTGPWLPASCKNYIIAFTEARDWQNRSTQRSFLSFFREKNTSNLIIRKFNLIILWIFIILHTMMSLDFLRTEWNKQNNYNNWIKK